MFKKWIFKAVKNFYFSDNYDLKIKYVVETIILSLSNIHLYTFSHSGNFSQLQQKPNFETNVLKKNCFWICYKKLFSNTIIELKFKQELLQTVFMTAASLK